MAGAVDLDVGGAGTFTADLVEEAKAAVGFHGEGADFAFGLGDYGKDERPGGVDGEEGRVDGFCSDFEVAHRAGIRVELEAVNAFFVAGSDINSVFSGEC